MSICPICLHPIRISISWAVLAGQADLSNALENGRMPSFLEVFELFTAAIAVIMLGIALWQTRVRFIRPDGEEWISTRFPVRVPPDAEIHRSVGKTSSVYWYGAIACAALCNLAILIDLLGPPADVV